MIINDATVQLDEALEVGRSLQGNTDVHLGVCIHPH